MYEKMLVTLDGSELSECVLPHAEAFREGFPGCEIILLRVVESTRDAIVADTATIRPDQWIEREKEMVAAAEDYLKQVMVRLEQGGSPVRPEVTVGRVEERITDIAEREEVDLILMATHGRSGVSRWVMGSIAEKVLRTAHAPVLMVRAPGSKGGK